GPASRQGGLAAADTAAPVPPGARREARARDGAPRRPLEEAEPTAADAEPETLLLDAAVRVLAGDDPAAERLPLAVAAESPPGFDEARDRALASFAATLPGFAGSSAVYLRRWFLRREALVEPLADGTIRVVLEPGPLDPALDLLPYPLGAFRLPWTPPLAVERRRSPA
ncbi:MAG: hypothetical protein ACXVZ4_09780, partial [Gaiellaceae bacterium]